MGYGGPRSRTSRCGFGDHRVTDTPVPRGAANCRRSRRAAVATRRRPCARGDLEQTAIFRNVAFRGAAKPSTFAQGALGACREHSQSVAQVTMRLASFEPLPPPTFPGPPSRRSLHARLAADAAGFMLMEVLISAFLVSLVVVASLTGFQAATRATAARTQGLLLGGSMEARCKTIHVPEN